MNIRDEVMRMKQAAPEMAASPVETRNRALERMAAALREHREDILAANAEDLAAAESAGVPQAVRKRLRYDDSKMRDSAAGLRELIQLLTKVTVPIGVIGVIFEARPDAMVQVASLCIKSGNCAILKGGKETAGTNRVLFTLIHQAAVEAGLPEAALFQAEAHNEIDELLACDDCVDLLIPRGSGKFVRYIMDHTKIPVMGHSSGICHIYVDRDADQDKAVPVILDAKTQYPAACNAVETLLINRGIAGSFLPRIVSQLAAAGVAIHGTEEAETLLTRRTGTSSPECCSLTTSCSRRSSRENTMTLTSPSALSTEFRRRWIISTDTDLITRTPFSRRTRRRRRISSRWWTAPACTGTAAQDLRTDTGMASARRSASAPGSSMRAGRSDWTGLSPISTVSPETVMLSATMRPEERSFITGIFRLSDQETWEYTGQAVRCIQVDA